MFWNKKITYYELPRLLSEVKAIIFGEIMLRTYRIIQYI